MSGDLDVEKVTYGHVEDFAVWLQKTRSNLSANIYLKNFKPFFTWLVSRGYIENNPCENLTLFVEEQKEGEVFEPQEIERIIKIASPVWKGIFVMALCGMRRGEILNLIVKDIFFDKEYILITPKRDTDTTWRWDIKNHAQRIAPLPKIIRLSDCELNVPVLLMDIIDSNPAKQPYVFVEPTFYQKMMRLKADGRLTHYLRKCPWGNFSRDFRGILKRARVPFKKFHDLRATFATQMLNNEISLAKTQKLLGHSSPATTARYYARFKRQELIAESTQILEKCYAYTGPIFESDTKFD
jgi:integrase